jgi:transcription elongation factor Elf1
VDTGKERTFIQCLNCGHIHTINKRVSVGVSVVSAECPKCEWLKGLNCGQTEEEIYYFYDPGLDERYFKY